jgi:hypothetical protein
MQPLTRPLLLLHIDEQLLRSLALVQGQPYRLIQLSSWVELRRELRRAPPAAIAVVDPFLGVERATGPSEELQATVREFPTATVVAALSVSPEDSAVLLTLGEWGVADCIDVGRENTPLAVGRRLGIVHSMPMRRLLSRALPRGVPSRPAGFLLRAAEVVAAGGKADHLAQALGVGVRTVLRWFQRVDLPPPSGSSRGLGS